MTGLVADSDVSQPKVYAVARQLESRKLGATVIEAVEVLDREVGRVLDAAVECGYSVILSADHGNCDEMVDPVTQTPHTQHTLYPVPCLVIDPVPWNLSIGAGLDAIAPTVLALMGLPKPAAMHGHSLLLSPARN